MRSLQSYRDQQGVIMRVRTRRVFAAAVSAASLVFVAALARASAFNVTVDSAPPSGSPAVLVFDFIDGGMPNNTVSLSALTSNGTQGSTSAIGNVTGTGVTGTGPWTFSDAGSSFFNELQVPYNPMGSSLSFSFATSDNPPDPGSFPDAFSFFILETDVVTPLITTNDPTGADALFLYNIGQGTQSLNVYAPDQTGVSINVIAAQSAPEPGSLALLVAGIVALSTRSRFMR
jgi:hypothetical protein